jgi:hypothetical protein
MSARFRSYHVIAKEARGEVRGWLVTASSPRDAKKHAVRQLRECFGGRWTALQVRRASKALLSQAGPR